MGKLLFWVVVIAAVWIAIKFAQASARRVERSARDARAGRDGDGGAGSRERDGAANAARGELMIRCAHCGVYFPQSDAVSAGSLRYCSIAHRDAGPRGS
ncbi:MAG TPA: PP0621 family protein [Burkholderiaceae bacterium]